MKRLKSKLIRRGIQVILVISLICLLNPYAIVKQQHLLLYEQSIEDLGESYVWCPSLEYLCLSNDEDQLKMIEMIKRARPAGIVVLATSNRKIIIGKNELSISGDFISFPKHSMLLFKLKDEDAHEISRMFMELPRSEEAPWYDNLINYEYMPLR